MEQPGNFPKLSIPVTIIWNTAIGNFPNILGIYSNFQFKRMIGIDAYKINYVYQKIESQGDIAYLMKN